MSGSLRVLPLGGLGEIGLRDLSFNDIYPQLTVSGPIVKDKAWYFVAAEYRQEETPVNALTQAFVRTHEESRLFGKASWDISTNHKLVFTATFDPQRDDNQGLDSFTAIESGFSAWAGGRSLVLRETAVFSPNVFLDTIVKFDVDSGEVDEWNLDNHFPGEPVMPLDDAPVAARQGPPVQQQRGSRGSAWPSITPGKLVVIGILVFLLGAVWYGPLFGARWTALVGASPEQARRDVALDLVRGLAIVILVVNHIHLESLLE